MNESRAIAGPAPYSIWERNSVSFSFQFAHTRGVR